MALNPDLSLGQLTEGQATVICSDDRLKEGEPAAPDSDGTVISILGQPVQLSETLCHQSSLFCPN